MHESNLLELLPPELISFILKYLPDLKHASGINDIWEREVNHERPKRVILTDFRFRIDICANANFISEKIVKIAYAKDNSIPRVYGFPDESYSTLGKVNLRIILNDGEKHKIIPTEFIVTGPDWPDQFPEILLGSLWMQENRVRLNMYTAYIIYGTFRCYKFTGTIGADSIFPRVHLDLNFSTGFGDKTLNRIAETYPNLKYLNLQKSGFVTFNGGGVTDKGLCAIARSCLKLEYLNISYRTEITWISICDIIHSCPRLQHLNFSYCGVTNEIIKEIGSSCLNLKYLKLEGCDIVSKEAIDQLVSLNPNIHVENFVCTIIPAYFDTYPGTYELSRRMRMSVDAPRDIMSVHNYVRQALGSQMIGIFD
ncbi:hypothetical protein GLOIN_2v1763772 [Rhizophagus clarus]|uniref:F-box domain-containing protein n=1 Tax=Rhizophagus clarus TaxID=94130 RepID=A0A8H3KUJ5_9GLOM|nr:hypothetical protein GLOIN_2v1763772 [Rhizophagus clarus]